MARDAVLSLLKNDSELATLGGTGFKVVANYSQDQRPNDVGAFIEIRWGVDDFDRGLQGPRHFDVWVHIPVSVSTDFVRIDAMIDRIDDIFAAANATDTVGGDGVALNYVEPEGRSGDLDDEGYMTICRRASYRALSCKASAL